MAFQCKKCQHFCSETLRTNIDNACCDCVEFEPFGEEWRKELRKMSKPNICRIFKIDGKGLTKEQIIDEVRNKLLEQKKGYDHNSCQAPSQISDIKTYS